MLWAQHTSSEVLIFQFCMSLFSENVFQSAVELHCQMPVTLVHSTSPQHVHISYTDLPLAEFYVRAAVYFFPSLVDKQQMNWELWSSVAFWKVWGTIWSFFSSWSCTCAATGTPHMLWLKSVTHKGFSVSLPLLETLCVSALWYVDTIVTFLLSCHFSTVTEPKCLAMTMPFPVSYLSLPWGHSFSSVLVCQQSVECSIFSFLANFGLLKLSIHNVCPWPNKGSKSSSTTAAILHLLQLCCQFHYHYY